MVVVAASSGVKAGVKAGSKRGTVALRAACPAAASVRVGGFGRRAERLIQGAAPSPRQARRGQQPTQIVATASADPSQEATTNAAADDFFGEVYETNLPKPLGVQFARGNDGQTYVASVNPNRGNIDDKMQPGDKVLAVSASFGADVWDALNYGQVAYAIRTRSGDVYLKMQSRGGDMSCFEAAAAGEDSTAQMFKAERAGGNYGIGTKELQQRNYVARKEAARERRELFDDALEKFNAKDFQTALVDWENVLGMEPANYMSDSGSRVTQIYQVSAYNIACCYAKMGQVDAGLSALDDCMRSGFDNYDKIRSDPNLQIVRDSEKFKPLINKYDEPIINEDAINAIKNLFNFGGKK